MSLGTTVEQLERLFRSCCAHSPPRCYALHQQHTQANVLPAVAAASNVRWHGHMVCCCLVPRSMPQGLLLLLPPTVLSCAALSVLWLCRLWSCSCSCVSWISSRGTCLRLTAATSTPPCSSCRPGWQQCPLTGSHPWQQPCRRATTPHRN